MRPTTEAEEIVKGYTGKLKERAVKIAENIIRLEGLIAEITPGIENEPLYIVEQAGERYPHEVKKENPALKEYKSLITTHANLVKQLKDILEIHEEQKPDEVSEWDKAFEDMRK